MDPNAVKSELLPVEELLLIDLLPDDSEIILETAPFVINRNTDYYNEGESQSIFKNMDLLSDKSDFNTAIGSYLNSAKNRNSFLPGDAFDWLSANEPEEHKPEDLAQKLSKLTQSGYIMDEEERTPDKISEQVKHDVNNEGINYELLNINETNIKLSTEVSPNRSVVESFFNEEIIETEYESKKWLYISVFSVLLNVLFLTIILWQRMHIDNLIEKLL